MPQDNHNFRVLLVDDHTDTRVVIAKLLQLVGHVVETAGDCASALAVAKQRRFDLLLVDVGLPDGSGLKLLTQIRDLYPIDGIVLSGYGMPGDVQESEAAGFSVHLIKPIEAPMLYAAVVDACRGEATPKRRSPPSLN